MLNSLLDYWKKPLFVYFLGLHYLIYKTSLYFPSFESTTFVVFCVGYFLLTHLMIFLFHKLKLNKYSEGLICIFWVGFFYTDKILNDFEINTIILQGFKWQVILISLIVIIYLYFISRKKIQSSNLANINRVLNTFFIIAIVISLSNGYMIITKEKDNQNHLSINWNSNRIKILSNRPNIIWLLLDEYASTPQFKQMGYENKFGDSLRKRGFYVFDSISTRSNGTLFSVNGIFNLDDTSKIENFQYAGHYLENNNLISKLKLNNYAISIFDFLKIDQNIPEINMQIFMPYSYWLRLLDGTLFSHFYFNYIVNKKTIVDNYNEKVLQKLAQEIVQKGSTPKFIWAHLLIPHPPFSRDSLGNKVNAINLSTENLSTVNASYINYAKYANNISLKLLSKINANDSNIVIISGDHGFRFNTSPKNFNTITFAAVYSKKLDTTELKKVKFIQQILFYTRTTKDIEETK